MLCRRREPRAHSLGCRLRCSVRSFASLGAFGAAVQALLIALRRPAAHREPRTRSRRFRSRSAVRAGRIDPLFSEVLSAASRPRYLSTSMPPATAPSTPSSQPPTPAPPTPAPPARRPGRRRCNAPSPLRRRRRLRPRQRRSGRSRHRRHRRRSPPPPPPAPSPDGCERIVTLVNQVRQENGLAPLAYNSQLGDAAQRYADFLAGHNVLNHTADGRTLDARAEAAGYTTWVALGENLAGGYTSFEEALTAWLASPGPPRQHPEPRLHGDRRRLRLERRQRVRLVLRAGVRHKLGRPSSRHRRTRIPPIVHLSSMRQTSRTHTTLHFRRLI